VGRASSSKKVARAARASGRPGTGRNWGYPLAISAIVVVGVALIVFSRPGDDEASAAPAFGDHWHAAQAVYTCGQFQDPLADRNDDANGIHTHEDGLIHIHPTSTEATGDNATLGVFTEETELVLQDDRLEIPDGDSFVEGEDECDDGPGIVQVAVWDDASDEEPTIRTEDLIGLKLDNNDLITIAFAPEGADIPKPNTAARLADATAAEEGRPVQPIEGVPDPSTTTTTVPGAPSTSVPTAPEGGGSTTTAAPDSTTTTAAP
jgi:hypothetical protein